MNKLGKREYMHFKSMLFEQFSEELRDFSSVQKKLLKHKRKVNELTMN